MSTETETIRVEYVPYDPPKDLGYEADYSGNMVHRFLYGGYKVTFPDGFKVWSPHSAIEGTISAEPLDLEQTDFAGTTVREMLIQRALEVRDA